MRPMDWEKELQVARSAAMHAGDLAVGYQSQELKPESKPDLSPVTIADRECEKRIVEEILAAFPNDGILGEEGASRESRNGRKWIVDPIDGTRDFVRGLPYWAVLIGLEVDGEVVVGVTHMPALKNMYHAAVGRGAFRNDRRISIAGIDSASDALVCVNGLNNLSEFFWAPRLVPWMDQFWAVRSLGGCMDAMMLASGHAELWLEAHAQPWDLAAVNLILQEAGARVRNFDGGNSIYGGNAIAYVPPLEGVVRDLLGW
ncbi:MAG TPA: inositol monophosphatase [Bryobacteraceae bacterium]|nr:inositol monophosphatase [Bryobacteraceae bacterium]